MPASQASTALTIFRVVDGRLTVRRARCHADARGRRVPRSTHSGSRRPAKIADGTATVSLDGATPGQVASIVYTLTQFPSVQRVDVGTRTGLTRDDVSAFAPPILVESPLAEPSVPPTFTVSGTASVFEATLVVELTRDGKRARAARR